MPAPDNTSNAALRWVGGGASKVGPRSDVSSSRGAIQPGLVPARLSRWKRQADAKRTERIRTRVPKATHQRAPLQRTSFTDPVWALLDLRFSLLLVAIIALYAALILVWALITWAAVPSHESAFDAPAEFTGLATYAAFTTSNVVTMGFGTVTPLTQAGFWLGTLQHFSGVLLNVFVFTIIITRVMHPSPDLAFSARALVMTRDGVVTLMFRVANLRCNYIFEPRVECNLLRRVRTAEGEVYMRSTPVAVACPAAISGCFTFAIPIEADSPLLEMAKEGKGVGDPGMIAILFTGTDDVYRDCVYAMKRYTKKDLQWGHRFADVMSKHTRTGKPTVDFSQFNETVPLTVTRYPDVDEPSGPTPASPPVLLPADAIHLFAGAALLEGTQVKGCAFSFGVECYARELGLPIVVHLVSMVDKPEWYVKHWAPEDAKMPSMSLRGEWLMDSAVLYDHIVKTYPVQAGALPQRCLVPEGPMHASDAPAWAMMRFINHEPADETYGVHPGVEAALAALQEALAPQEETLARYPYTCGVEPGLDDCRRACLVSCTLAVATVWGLDEVLNDALPHTAAWMRRMMARPSMQHTFPPRREFLLAHGPGWAKKVTKRIFPPVLADVIKVEGKGDDKGGAPPSTPSRNGGDAASPKQPARVSLRRTSEALASEEYCF